MEAQSGRATPVPPLQKPKRKGGLTLAYKTCPECGANLDPGEVCDCNKPGNELESYLAEGDGDG